MVDFEIAEIFSANGFLDISKCRAFGSVFERNSHFNTLTTGDHVFACDGYARKLHPRTWRATPVSPAPYEATIRKPEVEKLKVLHIASFSGNIGDNASHQGLANVLRTLLPDHKITKLEIRNFYKNARRPHKSLLMKALWNTLTRLTCYFGGGGYLDYWVEGSATGCNSISAVLFGKDKSTISACQPWMRTWKTGA